MKIAVIGAGPAGIACAWQLAGNGHEVTLIERMQNLSAQGSGVLLQPVGLAALDVMGIRQEVEALGNKLNQINGTSLPSGRQSLSVDYRVLKKINYALGVNRTALWNILYERAKQAGVEILCNINIEKFNHEADDSVTIIDHEANEYSGYELVVDASGARSKLNAYAERPAESRVLDYGSLWAKVELPVESSFNQNQMVLYSDQKNLGIGIMPIGKETSDNIDMATLFFNLNWRDCPDWSPATFLVWKQEMIDKWPDAAHLIAKLNDHKQLYLAKFHQHTLPMPYGDKIVFIGDAAHAAAPQLGLGINMSLIDALVLPRALEQTNNIESALKLYTKLRFKHVTFYQTLARVLTPFYQSDIRSGIILRDYLYAILAKLFMMKKIIAYLISGQLFNPLRKIKKI